MSYQRYSTSVQTLNATPVIIVSIPVATSSSADITIEFSVLRSDFANGAYGEGRVLMRRAGGNIARATGNGGLLSAALTILGDFTVMPRIDIVANTATQTADVTITGLAATTLNWVYSINVKRNSP